MDITPSLPSQKAYYGGHQDMVSGQPKLCTENLVNNYGDENQVENTPPHLYGGTPGQFWPTDTTPF